jgi:hypothetical protein
MEHPLQFMYSVAPYSLFSASATWTVQVALKPSNQTYANGEITAL